jgi:hypothetical protein
VVVGEREAVEGVEPAVVGMAPFIAAADLDHVFGNSCSKTKPMMGLVFHQ